MDCTRNPFTSSYEIIEWIATNFRSDILNVLMRVFSSLGTEEFVIAFICIGMWLKSKTVFIKLSILVIFSVLVNFYLKGLFSICRPPIHLQLVKEVGFSFPSGHSQIAGTMWLFLALQYPSKRMRSLCALFMIMIPISRIYLGVHFLHDIIVGLVLGAFICLAARYLEEIKMNIKVMKFHKLSFVAISILLLTWGAFFNSNPVNEHWQYIGLLLGLLFSIMFLTLNIPMRYHSVQSQIIIVTGGMVGILLLRYMLKYLFVYIGLWQPAAHLIRYAVLSMWIVAFYPLICQKYTERNC